MALEEDFGEKGDVTTQYTISSDAKSLGRIFTKQDCLLSGGKVAKEVFKCVDSKLEVDIKNDDGARLGVDETVMLVKGSTRSILQAERTALNFIQRMSGVASLTDEFVRRARSKNPQVEVLDTRKTSPCLRYFEKSAVVSGGGKNHRFGLYDAFMAKDNHLAWAEGYTEGGLIRAIQKCKEDNKDIDIIVEVDTLRQLDYYLDFEDLIDVILLDNMSLEMLEKSVQMRTGSILLEASGGVTLDNIASIAATQVDRISVGALTHSYVSMDFSLEIAQLDV